MPENYCKIYIFTITLLFNCIGNITFAQEFKAGIYAGMSACQLDGDRYSGYNKAGITGGVFVNRLFNTKIAYQLGLRYAQKGSSRVDNKNNVFYKSDLHYAELPVSVRYYHYKKLDFEAGISLNYLIKAREDKTSYGYTDANPAFNKFEVGGFAGINYNFTNKWLLMAHFCYSLTAARPYSSNYERFMDKGQHNNVIAFTIARYL